MKLLVSNILFFFASFLSIGQVVAQTDTTDLSEIIKTSTHIPRKVSALNQVAFQLTENNPDSAFRLATLALELAANADYMEGEAEALLNRAIANTNMGNYYLALQEFLQAHDLFENLNNRDRKALVLNNLGRMYNFMGELEKARGYFEAAAVLYAEMNNGARESIILNNLGHIEKLKGNYVDALSYLQQALHKARNSNPMGNQLYPIYNIGSVYMYLNQPDSAFKYLKKAENIAQDVQDNYILTLTYQDLGSLYEKLGNFSQAKDLYLQAYKLAATVGLRAEKKTAAQKLASLYEHLGNYEDALMYYKEYKAINDSLINMSVARQIAFKEAEDAFHEKKLVEDLEYERLKAENEKKLNNAIWTRNTLAAGIVAMIMISYLIYLNVKRKKLSNQALQNLNLQIEKQAEELRKVNEEIITMNNNLEKIVKKRTEELKRKNELLQNYLSTNSHIVRAPLARILGLVDLYKSGDTENLEFISENLYKSAVELDMALRNINENLSDIT